MAKNIMKNTAQAMKTNAERSGRMHMKKYRLKGFSLLLLSPSVIFKKKATKAINVK